MKISDRSNRLAVFMSIVKVLLSKREASVILMYLTGPIHFHRIDSSSYRTMLPLVISLKALLMCRELCLSRQEAVKGWKHPSHLLNGREIVFSIELIPMHVQLWLKSQSLQFSLWIFLSKSGLPSVSKEIKANMFWVSFESLKVSTLIIDPRAHLMEEDPALGNKTGTLIWGHQVVFCHLTGTWG